MCMHLWAVRSHPCLVFNYTLYTNNHAVCFEVFVVAQALVMSSDNSVRPLGQKQTHWTGRD